MDDISVGDYVRTKDGIIGKVFEEDDIGSKGVCIDNSFFDDYAEITDFVYYENILKHSFNIIDLIEVGDYVNGILVTGKEGTLLYTEIKGIDGSGYHIPISQYGDNIEKIVTKECFESVSYEV